ncbi:phenazine biosynthesis protein phzF [Cadophora sp. MPI-SDFR-AT-0126]|nr:phenazine biosynthesis protein phzF [Leotiomycetes sp. MPI-SDFR-AT-0126]
MHPREKEFERNAVQTSKMAPSSHPPSTSPNITPSTTLSTAASHNSHTNPPMPSSPSQSLTLPFTTLDVFTSAPYTGNPLALVRIPSQFRHLITKSQKQNIAAEFNLSETIFLHEQLEPLVPEWDVEIFTTDAELPFAGHPVIGTAAYVLGVLGAGGGEGQEGEKGRFMTRAGGVDIAVVYDDESRDEEDGPCGIEPGKSSRVSADIPHNVHIHSRIIGDLERSFSGLSYSPAIRKAELQAPFVSIVQGMTFLLVKLESLDMLGAVEVSGEDFNFHGVLDEGWQIGFVAKYYFVVLEEGGVTRVRSRMLETAVEDPATGSAASALCCYLAMKGGESRRRRFEVTQGVEMGRRSVIGVEVLVGQGKEGRKVEGVKISGNAVVVMEGNLRV